MAGKRQKSVAKHSLYFPFNSGGPSDRIPTLCELKRTCDVIVNVDVFFNLKNEAARIDNREAAEQWCEALSTFSSTQVALRPEFQGRQS